MGIPKVILRVSQHIFGTDGGYRTLAASPDVTGAERSELESFSFTFGQTADSDYLASLVSNPAFCSRVLSSGRRSVTRALCGPRDDQGRSTLLFISYVFDGRHWRPGVDFHDAQLQSLGSLWTWSGSTAPPVREIIVPGVALGPCPAAQRQRVLSVVAALETISREGDGTIVAPEGSLSVDDARVVAALLPASIRGQFSFAMRSLSDGLPVHLNCLAASGSRGKSRRRAVVWTGPGMLPREGYAAALAFFWRDGGLPPREFADNCCSYDDARQKFERVAGPAAMSQPQARAAPRAKAGRGTGKYWVLALVLLALLATTGVLVWRKLASAERVAALLGEAKSFLERSGAEELPDLEACSTGRYVETGQNLLQRVDALSEEARQGEIAEVRTRIEQSVAAATERCARIVAAKETLAAFREIANKLGINTSVAMETCPGDAVLKDVEGWKSRLAGERDAAQAEGLDGVEQFDEAMQRIEAWQKQVDELKSKVEYRLGELEKFYGAPRPRQLSVSLLNETEIARDHLERIKAESSDGDLSQRVNACDKLAESWRSAVDDLQTQHNAIIKQVESATPEIEGLAKDEIRSAWDSIAKAELELDQAREIWPDSTEVERIRSNLAELRRQISDRASELFCDAVRSLREDWSPGMPLKPSARNRLQKELELAIAEAEKCRDIIDFANAERVMECRDLAGDLRDILAEEAREPQPAPEEGNGGDATPGP